MQWYSPLVASSRDKKTCPLSHDVGVFFSSRLQFGGCRTVRQNVRMEMLKIEQVIVGNDMKSASPEMKPEPVVRPIQSYHHESVQCFQCFITFSDPKAKERHMRKSHRDQYKQQLQQTNTVFTCYKCDKSFSVSEELTQHQISHNTEEKSFRCPYCRKSFYTFTELNKHRRHDCVERRCPCRDCGALFPSPSRLRTHRIVAHSQNQAEAEDINTYQCCKCSCGFQTEEELLQHQEKFANDLNCNVKAGGKKRGRKPKNVAQGGMEDGKKIKLEEEAEGCSDSPTEGSSSTELKIPCSETDCDCTFSSVASLRAHKKEMHGATAHMAHSCSQCEESFAQPEQLKAHVSTAHNSEYTCGKGCGIESSLKGHQNTHTEGEEAAEKR